LRGEVVVSENTLGWLDAETGRAMVLVGSDMFVRDPEGAWSKGFVMPQDWFDNFALVSTAEASTFAEEALAV
jgi:hypothetical protein